MSEDLSSERDFLKNTQRASRNNRSSEFSTFLTRIYYVDNMMREPTPPTLGDGRD